MTSAALPGLRRPWTLLRARIRASELWLVALAAMLGAVSGLLTVAVSFCAHGLQALLYHLPPEARLSTLSSLSPVQLFILPLGGLVLGALTWLWSRRRPGPPVDPVEANALRGGRMSGEDSAFVGVQSVISNGFGASVGLEAAFAQLGAAAASLAGRALHLRRGDIRAFVGAGAGAGIAAAFGAPLTGAFYAFEIIIGSYAVGNIAPVVAAALAGALVSRLIGIAPMAVHLPASDSLPASHYVLFGVLGLICAVFGVAIMRLVAWTERNAARLPIARWLRPAVGGVALAGLASFAPHTLSAGHGALRLDLAAQLGMAALLTLILAKAAASVIALGFGFRGGLFFASLYLGALVGRLFIVALSARGFSLGIDPTAGAVVGMAALAVAIIGGPFTMTFLVLETTGDFGLTAATLTASIVASLFVRETFGYSFSTWRLHLRGETIRSAHDVSWLRTLTAGRMMREDVASIAASASLESLRRAFPLGSTRRLLVLDEGGGYAGLIALSAAHGESDPMKPVSALMIQKEHWLTPEMTIKDVMAAFDDSEADELAVLSPDRKVLGIVTESHATRRYAEELERARRDLVGAE